MAHRCGSPQEQDLQHFLAARVKVFVAMDFLESLRMLSLVPFVSMRRYKKVPSNAPLSTMSSTRRSRSAVETGVTTRLILWAAMDFLFLLLDQ
jgi:hypothetical protein